MIFRDRLRGLNRRQLVGGAAGLLAAPSIIQAQSRANGVALVIGNSKYQWEASLPNVRRDAPDIAKQFQQLGLKTELLQDLGRDALVAALEKFRIAARGADLAAFYFAGHGASWARDTYIVPVDTDLSTPSVVKSLVPTGFVGSVMRDAAHRLLVFDNCRNNPADDWRQQEAKDQGIVFSGRNSVVSEENSLVLYSTAPGRVALDGPPGQNSPFAAGLMHELGSGAVDLQALPERLRRNLLIATRGKQVLYAENSYSRPFVLNAQRGNAASARSGVANSSTIIEMDKAYAYSKQQDILLPPGLIAIRPTNPSDNERKSGSFSFKDKALEIGVVPAMLLVLSVDDPNESQIIVAGKSGGTRGGSYWRFITAKLPPNQLVYVPHGEGATVTFEWLNDRSGHVGMIWGARPGRKPGVFETDFFRMDG